MAGLIVFAAAPASAAVVSTTGCAASTSCTLAELFAGGALTVDDVTFSGFALDAANTTSFGGAPAFNPSAAVATGAGAAGTAGFTLGFQPALALGAQGEEIEVSFTFDATVRRSSSREMNGLSIAAPDLRRSGDASFDANAELLPIDGAGLAQIIADNFGGVALADAESFTAIASGSFALDFGLVVFASGASIGLPSLDFAVSLEGAAPPLQVIPLPAAAPLMLGGMAALGLLAARRRTPT